MQNINSIQNNQENDALVRIVKPEDIHKMHAYLDAIPLAKTAIVIYPGTEIIFYHKNDFNGNEASLFTFGVGAVPLSPSNQMNFIETINLFKANNNLG